MKVNRIAVKNPIMSQWDTHTHTQPFRANFAANSLHDFRCIEMVKKNSNKCNNSKCREVETRCAGLLFHCMRKEKWGCVHKMLKKKKKRVSTVLWGRRAPYRRPVYSETRSKQDRISFAGVGQSGRRQKTWSLQWRRPAVNLSLFLILRGIS